MKKYSGPILILLFSGLLISGCTKNFENINTNPNAPEAVPATTLLLAGISNGFHESLTMYDGSYGGIIFRSSGFWCEHWAEVNPALYQIDRYNGSLTVSELQWRQIYTGPLADLQTILDDPDNGPNVRGAAMVMRACLFAMMTDLFGDIPFTQANQVEQFVQPAYDTQESIYKNLTAQLAQAATLFDPGADELGRGDVLYLGDVTKWEKFANTLRARLLNRYKHLDNQAKQDLIALLSDPATYPVFESNADDAALIPVGALPYIAPFYQVNLFWPNFFIPSATLVETLKSFSDPRMPFILQPNEDGEYIGLENGVISSSTAGFCRFNTLLLNDPQLAMPVLTYPELLFIKAEVFNDKQAYLEGIAAAMETHGVTPTPVSQAAAEAAWAQDPLDAIITQKWIALLLNENEAFTEYRRTGFPSSIQENAGSNFPGKGLPRRYGYPLIEETTNSANLQAARERQHIVPGQEVFGDKMWWAK